MLEHLMNVRARSTLNVGNRAQGRGPAPSPPHGALYVAANTPQTDIRHRAASPDLWPVAEADSTPHHGCAQPCVIDGYGTEYVT